MRSVRIALVVGLALTALTIGVVLSGSPPTVAATNSVPAASALRFVQGGYTRCQEGETLPRDSSAIRLSLSANIGPRVTVSVLSGSSVVTHGQRGAGWGVQETVTVPVTPVPRAIPNARICVAIGPTVEPLEVRGSLVPTFVAGGGPRNVGKVRIEYLRAGHTSWWSLVPSVARHMGLGREPSGTWIVFALLALMITITILASRLVLKEVTRNGQAPAEVPDRSSTQASGGWGRRLGAWAGSLTPSTRTARKRETREHAGADGGRARRWLAVRKILARIPRAAWICALIACLNAVAWSLVTPPFQAADEPSHFAYVQQIAETATLPTSGESHFSEEEEVALQDLHHSEVQWHPEQHTLATGAEQRQLEHDLAQSLSRTREGDAGVAAAQPPLYYMLQVIPYWLASGGGLLDQLALMRLLSALLAALTALGAYMFVREALPGAPWAWCVGGLAAALSPLLGFVSGVVTPDAMLYAISAAVFYGLARAFRRGLTPRLAIAIGVLSAIGFLTKNNFVGLAPGVALGLVVLAVRDARALRPHAYRSLAIALAIAASPVCVYAMVNLLSNHPGLGGVTSSAIQLTGKRPSFFHEVSYIWQFFLPRLPGMGNDFPGIFPARTIWFDRSIGLYGWLDTPFPVWVYNIALIPAALLTILAIRTLIARASALRSRLVELAVYVVMGVGLLLLVGADSFIAFPRQAGTYGEARYLVPLIPLYGAMLTLSARGAGRRWGPVAGVLIVTLLLGHDLLSQLQVIARFYG